MIAPGFEPGTYSLEVSCSIQLSYATYFIFVGVAGFEPAASCSQSRRDNRATLHPEDKKSGETGTRTLATVTRRQISNLLRYHSGTSPLILQELIFFAVANVCFYSSIYNYYQSFFIYFYFKIVNALIFSRITLFKKQLFYFCVIKNEI